MAISFILGSFLFCLAAWLAASPLGAQNGITPVPGRHAEVRTAFPFGVKDVPYQAGWRAAEFKDEGAQRYWKTDASPGCAAWSTFGDGQPGLMLLPGATNCAGGWKVEHGYFYWFSSPISPATPSLPGPTATGPPFGATVTTTPSPLAPTSTPGATGPPTPPTLPDCASSVWLYRAGDPGQGGLGGKVGDITWCESCKYNGSCGVWSLGVDQETLDDINTYIKQRVMR